MSKDKKLAKAEKPLLAMKGTSHKRPKQPTKTDLERRFKLLLTGGAARQWWRWIKPCDKLLSTFLCNSQNLVPDGC